MFATGLYTIPEAARLAGMKPDQVRRCIEGYKTGSTVQPALWSPSLPTQRSSSGHHKLIELGFADLIELRYVREFLNHGVKFSTLRICMNNAQNQLGTQRPFVSQKLQTDGKTIFLKGVERDAEATVDLKQLQMVLREVLNPTFLQLEFDAGEAVRWWPLQGKRSIVIDPAIAFGKPTAAESGVPTDTLATAVKAEGSISRVAKLYEVDEAVVRDAVSFEKAMSNS